MSVAHDLLAELAEHHVRVERRGDRLRLRAPAPPPADLLERLRQHKPEVLPLLPDVAAIKHGVNRPVLHFRLPGYKPNEWATALGRPGETVESLRADLRERWPECEVRQ